MGLSVSSARGRWKGLHIRFRYRRKPSLCRFFPFHFFVPAPLFDRHSEGKGSIIQSVYSMHVPCAL